MTTTNIRAEIAELINAGMLNVPKIVKYFRENKPEANLETVKVEAKELVNETKQIIKRGY
jgi:hypothetical protein